MKNLNLRTQYDDRLPVEKIVYPASVVQPGMSPSISQMVRTRSVGGQIDELEMDGIAEDAPFDSEYVDFFDIQDEAERLASEAKAGKDPAQPQKDSPPASETLGIENEAQK